MRKKKVALEKEFNILDSEYVKISYSDKKYLFEIGNEITSDLSEAVSILMREFKKDNDIWKIEIQDINIEDLEPAKALYWLSGGKKEWEESNNYKKYWHECLLDFQEEFGWTIVEIIMYSKTLGDVRESFLRNLNLPILYNFALSKEIA
jgi:hypothetical protein